MTLSEYIINPMGKNNAVLNSITREALRNHYKKKFDSLLVRENAYIQYYLFKDSKKNIYWAYIKVPSEEIKKFYYDVVFKFIPDSSTGISNDIFNYPVKFYSNDPAFVYTYAHVFAKNDLFITELSKKMAKKALKEEAKEKNPQNNIGYVKTIYFAYLLLKERGLNSVHKFNSESKPLDISFLIQNIEEADEKIFKRQEAGKHVSHKKKLIVDQNTAKNIEKIIGSQNMKNSNLAVRGTKKTKIVTPKKANANVSFTKTTKKK